jgi:hypothetical protein
MKSTLVKRSLAAPGHLHSLYYFLPTPLQHSLLVLAAVLLLLTLAVAG